MADFIDALCNWKNAGGSFADIAETLDALLKQRILAYKDCMRDGHILCRRCAEDPSVFDRLASLPRTPGEKP
jgi:hypothetical protein